MAYNSGEQRNFLLTLTCFLCNKQQFFVQHVQNGSTKNIVIKEKQMCSH